MFMKPLVLCYIFQVLMNCKEDNPCLDKTLVFEFSDFQRVKLESLSFMLSIKRHINCANQNRRTEIDASWGENGIACLAWLQTVMDSCIDHLVKRYHSWGVCILSQTWCSSLKKVLKFALIFHWNKNQNNQSLILAIIEK